MSPYGLAVDSKNNLYIAGWATDGLDVGTGPLPGGGIFLAKLDPQGEALWARRYIDTGADPSILSLWPLEFGVPWSSGIVEGTSMATAFALAIGTNDDVILTGRMVESLDFGVGKSPRRRMASSMRASIPTATTSGVAPWARASATRRRRSR